MPWSSTKQLRSVAETEFTVDDVFDTFMNTFGLGKITKEYSKQHSKSKQITKAYRFQVHPFSFIQQDAATALQYRKIPLPW